MEQMPINQKEQALYSGCKKLASREQSRDRQNTIELIQLGNSNKYPALRNHAQEIMTSNYSAVSQAKNAEKILGHSQVFGLEHHNEISRSIRLKNKEIYNRYVEEQDENRLDNRFSPLASQPHQHVFPNYLPVDPESLGLFTLLREHQNKEKSRDFRS